MTFYSYKGGTGRSMMLANTAWILASRGKRVLAIDWDLEAPGLHRYFEPFLVDVELTHSLGLIDLVTDFVTAALSDSEVGEEHGVWFEPLVDIRRYASALDTRFTSGGVLHFVPAGRQGTSYATRVNSFDWTAFYERFDGGAYLDSVKAKLKAQYDFILIDSRTGVSDTSGICTVQMPDTLVVCFTLNNQGIDGASAVARSALSQRVDPLLRILPVPMRLDTSEMDKLEARRRYAREQFGGLPNDRPVEAADKYWAESEVMYVPWYSYEEVLAAFIDPPGRSHTVLTAAERLTAALTRGEIAALMPPSDDDREYVRTAYQKREEGTAVPSAVSRRFDVFISYDQADELSVEGVVDHLRGHEIRPWFAPRTLAVGVTLESATWAGFDAARTCAFFVGRTNMSRSQLSVLDRAIDRAQSDQLFRYFAVLLPGADPSQLPLPLQDRLFVDLRNGLDSAALNQVVAAVRGVPPGGAQAPRDIRQARSVFALRLTNLNARLAFVEDLGEWLHSRTFDNRGPWTTMIRDFRVDVEELVGVTRAAVRDLTAAGGEGQPIDVLSRVSKMLNRLGSAVEEVINAEEDSRRVTRPLDLSIVPELARELEWSARSLRREANLLLEQSEPAGTDLLHREYAGLDQEARLLFEKSVGLLGGISMREQGLDGDLFELGDELIREVALDARLQWQPSLPRMGAPGLQGTVSVLLPDWTMWSLPLVVHEFAHGAPPFDRELPSRVARRFGETLSEGSAAEHVADAFSVTLVGPAYACAQLLLSASPSSNRETQRAQARGLFVLAMLRRLMVQDSVMLDFVEEIRYRWEGLYPEPLDDQLNQSGELAAVVAEEVELALPRGGQYLRQSGSSVSLLADSFGRNIPVSDLQPNSLRDVLNAAWLARLNDESAASRLQASSLSLAQTLRTGVALGARPPRLHDGVRR